MSKSRAAFPPQSVAFLWVSHGIHLFSFPHCQSSPSLKKSLVSLLQKRKITFGCGLVATSENRIIQTGHCVHWDDGDIPHCCCCYWFMALRSKCFGGMQDLLLVLFCNFLFQISLHLCFFLFFFCSSSFYFLCNHLMNFTINTNSHFKQNLYSPTFWWLFQHWVHFPLFLVQLFLVHAHLLSWLYTGS